MTERWRKKLGDLDATGPNDDVFDRAHEGPMHPDDVIPLPKTSTKIVTGVAAFLVFALAISVFAIPALRMNNEPGSFGASGDLPLWPARSLDDLESLQQRADSGEADAVWALDPNEVGQRFAAEVLGWDSALVGGGGANQPGCPSVPGTAVSCLPTGSTPTAVAFADRGTPMGYPTSSPPTGYPSGPPTTAPVPRRIELVLSYDALCTPPCPQNVAVELYQPLGMGEGSVWAVSQVQTPTSGLGPDGGTLRDGDSIFGGTRLSEGEIPTLAYHVGPGSCDVDYATSEWEGAQTNGQEIQGQGVGLVLPVQHGCTQPTPGYVWLATAGESLIADDESGHVADPFVEGGGVMLTSLTAVRVTFVPPAPSGGPSFPSGGPPTAVPSTSPEAEPTEWVSYADPLGWTIDVPKDWDTLTFTGGPEVPGYAHGASFFSGSPSVTPGGPFTAGPKDGDVMVRVWHDDRDTSVADDSTFPLSMSDFQVAPGAGNVQVADVRGDGLPFTIDILYTAGADVSSLSPIVTHIVESIRFERLAVGEERNGWVYVAEVLPHASMQWALPDEGNPYLVVEGRSFFGPAPACDGKPTFQVSEGWVAGIACPDGSGGSWDQRGIADPSNEAPFGQDLEPAVAVRSWDGEFLVQLP